MDRMDRIVLLFIVVYAALKRLAFSSFELVFLASMLLIPLIRMVLGGETR